MTHELKKSAEVEQRTETDKSNASGSKTNNQIAVAITRFLHKARDIKWSARIFVPKAYEMMESRYKKAIDQIQTGETLLASQEAGKHVHGMKEMQEAVRKLERIRYSQTHKIVETSLFFKFVYRFR